MLGGPHLWFGARISPDGRRLLVSRTTTQLDFFLLELRTSSVRRLTNAPGGVRCGEWSPDGSRIVFLSAQRGDRQVRVPGTRTRGPFRWSTFRPPACAGVLSRVVAWNLGGRLALQQGPEDPAALILRIGPEAEGREVVRLPPYPQGAFIPRAWSANGKILAGTSGPRLVLYGFDTQRVRDDWGRAPIRGGGPDRYGSPTTDGCSHKAIVRPSI